MTSPKSTAVEVLEAESRRRWSAEEKLAMVRETYQPGMTVSLVARKHGVNPNQVFHWRLLARGFERGSLLGSAGLAPSFPASTARLGNVSPRGRSVLMICCESWFRRYRR